MKLGNRSSEPVDEHEQGEGGRRLGELVKVLMPPEEYPDAGVREAAGGVRLYLRVPGQERRVRGIGIYKHVVSLIVRRAMHSSSGSDGGGGSGGESTIACRRLGQDGASGKIRSSLGHPYERHKTQGNKNLMEIRVVLVRSGASRQAKVDTPRGPRRRSLYESTAAGEGV